MSKTRIFTSSEARTKHFLVSSGDAYTVFSEGLFLESENKTVTGPKQFMIKTADLDEFVEVVLAAKAAWEKAKSIERQTNA